jgi:hypothetical protein
MRLRQPLLALALSVAAFASLPAQEAAKSKVDTKALLTTMRENVYRISPSLEYDRWDANVRLWETYLSNRAPLKPEALSAMRNEYSTIVRIVAQLVGPEEKERWILNRDLWEMMLDAACVPPAETLAKMRPMLKTLEANLARITAPGEKQRWTANYELWMNLVGS